MREKKILTSLHIGLWLFLIVLIALSTSSVAAQSITQKKYDLRLRGLREGSGFTMMMIAMGEAIKRYYPGVTTSCTPSSSGLENAVALQKGKADIAVTMDSVICRKGAYQIKAAGPLPKIRNVMAVDAAPFNIFVTKESGITSIKQLEGKNFAGNLPGTMVHMVLQFILDEMGVKPNIKLMGTTACSDAIKDRKVVGTVKFGAPEPSVASLNATMGVRFLPIPADVLDRLTQKHSGLLAKGVIKAGTYAGQDYDVPTVTNATIICSTSAVPPWVVYAFLDSVAKDRSRISHAWAPLKKQDGFLSFEKFGLANMEGPLHVGAVQWMQDKGITVPAKWLPPEMKQ